jgi:hypothetical protein
VTETTRTPPVDAPPLTLIIEDEPINIFFVEEERGTFARALSNLSRRWSKVARQRSRGTRSAAIVFNPASAGDSND